jgi:hypothetical protein
MTYIEIDAIKVEPEIFASFPMYLI